MARSAIMKTTGSLAVGALLLALGGCEGPAGTNGSPGADGSDGVDGINASDGVDGTDGNNGNSGVDGTDGTDGVDGQPGEGYFPLEPAGLVGQVSDRTGGRLAGGTLYFVPAADVAALPATTIGAASPDDEPLEDVIAANGAGYQQVTVGADGRYSLPTLTDGSYFVTFMPHPADEGHLPGGSACRVALASADIVGTRLDLEVSSRPPADAEFVGSGKCITCHGKIHIADTMHRIGIWSPYESGLLQDLASRPELFQALSGKFTAAGTTVYFYDYDPNRGFDKYKTAETDPGAGVSFTVTAREAGGVYEMVLHNVKNPADPDRVYSVDVVYGGGVSKQRYLSTAPSGYHFTLPLQYQHEGQEGAPYGRTSKVWRDYHGDWHYNETSTTFTVPANSKSFEKNCISCHANGTQVTGSDATVWTASLISDPLWGDFDFNGDGMADEVNLGCETCHGPGSAHWEGAGLGQAIVSPRLLTPEREAMICGQCHSRPKGALNTDSPIDADGWMMWAGTSRADFLSDFAVSQLDGSANDFHADGGEHSKAHHQQYSDFIRSPMYKNGTELMTCSSCHDPHARANARQLRADPADEEALCGGACHATQTSDKSAHIDAQLGNGMGSLMASAACTQCHMAKTAKTGAGEPGITIAGQQYWQNDVSSHLFDVPDKSASAKVSPGVDMPTPYTDACGQGCHSSL